MKFADEMSVGAQASYTIAYEAGAIDGGAFDDDQLIRPDAILLLVLLEGAFCHKIRPASSDRRQSGWLRRSQGRGRHRRHGDGDR